MGRIERMKSLGLAWAMPGRRVRDGEDAGENRPLLGRAEGERITADRLSMECDNNAEYM